LALAGALLMWRLKKNGYYLYMLSVELGMIGSLVIFKGNFIGSILFMGVGFAGVLFIVLFSLNLKYLK
jgi:hypothetical protein